jgi:hypothetical protein
MIREVSRDARGIWTGRAPSSLRMALFFLRAFLSALFARMMLGSVRRPKRVDT